MSKANYVQEQFLGGEWSPFAQGRMSDREYKRAMKVCFNSFPLEEGAWTRRPGFRRGGPTRSGAAARMFRFDFAQGTPVTLEFTSGVMRAWQGVNLVGDGTGSTVTSVAGSGDASFTISDQGWAVGDHVVFQFGDGLTAFHNAALNQRQFELVTYATGVFTCKDAITGNTVQTSDLNFQIADVLTVSRILELTTSFSDVNLATMRRVATDDEGLSNAILLDGIHAPQELVVIDNNPSTFALADVVFSDGPYLDPVPGSLLTPDATSQLINMTLSFQAYSSTHVYNRGDIVTSSSLTYQSLQDVNLNHTPATSTTFWAPVSPGIAFGPAGVTSDDVGRHIRLKDSAGNWTWGKIVSLTTTGTINPTLAGSVAIGSLTSKGGLAGAFHGARQAYASSAAIAPANLTRSFTAYIGHNFTGATAQTISSATVRAPTGNSDFESSIIAATPAGVVRILNEKTRTTTSTLTGTVTLELRASQSAPASATSGTLLGSQAYTVNVPGGAGVDTANQQVILQNSAVTILSNDQSTSWKYVWVAFVLNLTGGAPLTEFCVGELDMATAGALAGTAFEMQLIGPALASTTTISNFAAGAYADSTTYPTCGAYHEGRLWLGGAIDNRFDGSSSNKPFQFSPSGADGTVADANAISETLNSSDVNPIFWFMPDLQGILIGTQGGEWILQASNANNVLTPTSIQAHRITKYGCANAEPVRTGLTTCFIQKFKRRVHEYLSDVFSGKFYAPNLTELAKHITTSSVQEIDFQEELAPIVWARRGDGNLAGCTYRRISMMSNEAPQFRAWHLHEHGGSHQITSMAVGPSLDGNLDALTVAALEGSGSYSVQVMDKVFDEEDVITNARFVDNYLVPAAIQLTATSFKLMGLVPFANETKSIFFCGLDCGALAIDSDGTVDVPFVSDPDKLLTKAYAVNIINTVGSNDADIDVALFDTDNTDLGDCPCVVGDTFTSRGQILPPYDPPSTGARTGPAFGKVTRHNSVAALLNTTVGISFGTDFDRPLKPAYFKSRSGKGTQVLRKDQPFRGTHYMTIDDEGTAMDNAICWEITRPYPATVVAIGGFDSTEDR